MALFDDPGKRWIAGNAAVGLIACCLLSGCGGGVGPIKADPDAVPLLANQFEDGSGSGAGATVELPEPTGFATLKGRFVVTGDVDTLPPLTTSGNDRAYCGTVPDDRVAVDSEGNLRNVLIYLNTKIPASYGTWIHDSYEASETALLDGAQAFDQEKCRFKWRIFAMRATQTVKVKNSDTVGHNTSIKGPFGVNSINPTLPGGSSEDYSPGKASNKPFAVSCSVHPWMAAYMISLDTPYFAVTDPSGTFEIANVPAGVPLSFSVWHEKSLYFKNLTLTPDLKTDRRGRFEITLNKDEIREIPVELPAAVLN